MTHVLLGVPTCQRFSVLVHIKVILTSYIYLKHGKVHYCQFDPVPVLHNLGSFDKQYLVEHCYYLVLLSVSVFNKISILAFARRSVIHASLISSARVFSISFFSLSLTSSKDN